MKKEIINSQKLFGNFLNLNVINKLIKLFDENNNNDKKFTDLIKDEREKRRLNNKNVILKSYVYGEDNNNST
jgi:hypothetical protein